MSNSEKTTNTETGVQSIVHTPGPWITSTKNGRVVVALNERANEKVATAANTGNPPVAWANAKLISLAPEMLAGIKDMLDAIEYSGTRLVGKEYEAKERLREILAKLGM